MSPMSKLKSQVRPSIVQLPEHNRPEPNAGVNWTPDHRINGPHLIPSWRVWLISRAIARRTQSRRFKIFGF